MSKVKLVTSVKLAGWLRKENCESQFTINSSKLYCQPCKSTYEFGIKSQLQQHLKTALHIKNLERFSARPERQLLLNEVQGNGKTEFFTEMCEAFLAADIPWKTLCQPKFRRFLEKYTENTIPNESTLRKNYLPRLYTKTMEEIREDIGNYPIWLQVDETKDPTGRCIVNDIVGALDRDRPRAAHLLISKEIPGDAQNSDTFARLVLDSFNLLWPGGNQTEIESKFFLLLSDAAPYMIKVGKILKKTYPKLLHVTCLSHGIHRVAEDIRAHFPNVNTMIGAVKAVFKKAPLRIRMYKTMYPELNLPPDVVITRWGKWLEALNFYCEHHGKILDVIQKFDATDAQAIALARQSLEKKDLKGELAYISSNFGFLVVEITALQKDGAEIESVLTRLNNVDTKLSKVKGKIGAQVYKKFKAVTSKNPNLSDMQGVAKTLAGKPSECGNIESHRAVSFRFAPLVTASVERSFSMEKNLLSDRRRSLTVENLEMSVVCHYYLTNPRIESS